MSHELYLSALALALTLPDTCGKAEYPNKKIGERYMGWCSQYLIKDRHASPYDNDMPYLNEEILFNLRNSMLHQSTPNVDSSRIHEDRCKVDRFILVATKDISANGDSSMVRYRGAPKAENVCYRQLTIHISHLCYIICEAAEHYYANNKEKFGFIEYSLVDDNCYEDL